MGNFMLAPEQPI